MCGIAGVLAAVAPDRREAEVARSLDVLRHRGPDGEGLWSGPSSGITLGHRRLAIVDLTDAAAQPMPSADGRWMLTFNGEVYGFRTLRDELLASGRRLRSTGDTEVLVELLAHHGPELALARLNGMYAIAAWDLHRQELWLARDPIGEKPLYVGRAAGGLAWASELGGLAVLSGFGDTISHDALATYLQLGYVPAPLTIYEGAEKLEPGEWRRYDGRGALLDSGVTQPAIASTVLDLNDDDDLLDLLRDAVAIRTVADVPVGVFLSGGVDSAIVAALAAQHGPTTTFTAAFSGSSYDESDHARAVARAIGSEHVELEVSPADALELAAHLPSLYGEPFGDPSAIPTHLIARAARDRVTVALTGDGGDELFGGYNRLVIGAQLEGLRSTLPPPLRSLGGAVVGGLPLAALERFGGAAGSVIGAGTVPNVAEKLHKAGTALAAEDTAAAMTSLVAIWPDPGQLLPGALPTTLGFGGGSFGDELLDFDRRMTLPEQMMTKVDRASMAVSLEARPPLLDPRLVAYATALPFTAHVHGRVGKQQLRRIVSRLIDPGLLDRPKMGFDPPVGAWLRGPLRSWAEELLRPSMLRASGISAVEPVRRSLARHLSGAGGEEYRLWTLLQYQLWFDGVHGGRSNPQPAVRPARRGTTVTPIEVRPFEEKDRSTVDGLLARSMKRTEDLDRFADLLRWKHEDNPFGPSPAWVAVDNGEVVGYRAFLRWEFTGQGRTWRAVRAVDTATDPAHQGRGIFRLLTLQGLEHLAGERVDFVFNTPNDQSRPGYLQMGWQLVGRLTPRIRPARLGAIADLAHSREAAEHWGEPVDAGLTAAEAFADDRTVEALVRTCERPDLRLRTTLSADYLRWRYDHDLLGYRVLLLGDDLRDGACCFRVRRRGAALEATICQLLVPGNAATARRALIRATLSESGADYALLLGGNAADLTMPLPRAGPTLVWRDLVAEDKPPLNAWDLTMGDIELL